MTCFWDALISSIKNEDFHNIFNYEYNLRPHPKEFVSLLKNKNIITNNVLWNNTELSKQQLDENFHAINQLDDNSINNGYDCSIFDPYLFLICEILEITIEHNYNGHLITYKHKKNIRYLLKFKSNTNHFERN